MTEKEFVIWFTGFVEACHEYAPTPKQWDSIKEKLKGINSSNGIPIGIGGMGTATFTALHTTTTNDKHILND